MFQSNPPPTLNRAAALLRLANNHALYDKILLLFRAQLTTLVGRINAYTDQTDKAFYRDVHTLKGSAAEIGAERLQHTLAQLEDQLRSNPDVFPQPELAAFNEAAHLLQLHLNQ